MLAWVQWYFKNAHKYPECLVLACWVVVVMVLQATDSAAAVGLAAAGCSCWSGSVPGHSRWPGCSGWVVLRASWPPGRCCSAPGCCCCCWAGQSRSRWTRGRNELKLNLEQVRIWFFVVAWFESCAWMVRRNVCLLYNNFFSKCSSWARSRDLVVSKLLQAVNFF